MVKTCANLTDVVRSVRLLKFKGYSLTTDISNDHCFKSRWNVDGYEWEIRIYPRFREGSYHYGNGRSGVVLHLIFLSEARMGAVRTTLRCCLVDPRGLLPSREDCRSITFRKPQDTSSTVFLMEKAEFEESDYVRDDSFTVQCTLDVLKELPDATAPLKELPLPSSNLHLQFAQLLQSETGADVTFLVAEFFGDMKEKCSQSVEIKDMEAEVFKALLQFIYTDNVPEFRHQAEVDAEAVFTDSVPEFEQQDEVDAEAATVMAQHLLAAADRYGLDRLKLICARELSGGINVDTAATTLAFADLHNCPELKARCVDFIIRTSATLDAVLATEGYKHLEASCPLVVIDIFKAARGRKN